MRNQYKQLMNRQYRNETNYEDILFYEQPTKNLQVTIKAWTKSTVKRLQMYYNSILSMKKLSILKVL